jgi:hypothetical protein
LPRASPEQVFLPVIDSPVCSGRGILVWPACHRDTRRDGWHGAPLQLHTWLTSRGASARGKRIPVEPNAPGPACRARTGSLKDEPGDRDARAGSGGCSRSMNTSGWRVHSGWRTATSPLRKLPGI